MTHPTVGLFLTLVLSLLVVPLAADAQQPTNVPPIGFLSARVTPTPATPDPNAEVLLQKQPSICYKVGFVNLLPINMGLWQASARRPQSGILKLQWIGW
jgi:hypothetical protein